MTVASGWRGIAAGALGLVALQTVVATQEGPGRVGGIFTSVAGAVAKFVDPTVPAFGNAKPKTAAAPLTPPTPTPAPYPSRNTIPDTVKSA